MPIIRIALIQQFCEKANISQNLADLSRHLSSAAAHEIDIVGFPEMNITGYADPTRYPDAVIRRDGPEIAEFLRRTSSFNGTVLAGFIEKNPGGKPYITQVTARMGELLGFYRKVTIKDEETEWFTPGDGIPVFQHGNLNFGISICADIENPQVFSECSRLGAQIVFELAAPGLYGEQATRNWQSGYAWWEGDCQQFLSVYARENHIWIGVATQAGRTIDEDFPGGGYLFAPEGQRVYATQNWSPSAAYLEIDLDSGAVLDLNKVG